MNLKILLPFAVFAENADVLRIIAETTDGSYGLLPNRLDCVAALVPGILTYEIKDGGTNYVAVDEGVLVKAGADVTVSVRRAIGGADLKKLKNAVESEFLKVNEQERNIRNAVAKMESGLIGRLAEFEDER
ncbi:MAG: F0F1 ATP synthase subunit epsilon [Terracidiphilus sp.]|jgi:F-type H+-transporting ATPase subunit epsilon